MIELVSIELTNFRAFTNATFQPAANGEGLTAIVGDNGSGKTSIVTALLWCLYGTTPNGVTVKSLRKQNTEEPVIVTTTFHHDNQTVTVERSLRGTQDKTVARITVDGQAQTEVSSRSATQWIINRTGLNAESFTSAFVVQQKELDTLVKARPAERRKTVERLAGIERMSKAIILAKEENKTRQTILQTRKPSLIDIDANTRRIKQFGKENIELEQRKQKLHQETEQLQKNLDSVIELLKKSRTQDNQRRNLQHEIAIIDTKISATRTHFAQHQHTIDAATNLTSDTHLRPVATLEEEYDTVAEKLSELDSITNKITAETQRHRTLGETLTRIEQQLADKKHRNDELRKKTLHLTKQIGDLTPLAEVNNTVNTLNQHIQELSERVAVTKNTITVTKDALTLMRTHASPNSENPLCPTCLNPIPNHEEIIQKFETNLNLQQKELADTETRLTERRTAAEETRTLLNTIKHLEEQKREIGYTIGSNETDMIDIQTNLDRQSDEYDTSAETLHTLKTLHPNLTQTIEETKTELAHIAETLRATENAEKATLEQQKLHTLTQKLEKERDTLTEQLAQLQPDTEETQTPEELETVAENLRNRITSITTTITSINHTIHTNTTQITLLEQENITHSEETRTYEQARLDAETSATTVTALEAFRKDRLARLTPELSEITTDLLAEMTNGKYVLAEFDDDFTPYVTTDTGETRPVTWLSGGEESLVALALRIAIGEILAGGRNGNLLILDEVLTAQDRNRRNATLTSIRGLDRQTIVVNHIEESTDVVDKVVYVTAAPDDNPDEGSTLT